MNKAFFALILAATPAMAAPEGCYTRHYSASHLEDHPAQIVANIWLRFGVDEAYDQPFAELGATMTDGAYLTQWLVCDQEGGAPRCAVECDGGSFVVSRDTFESIDIRTDYLLVGDGEGCGGMADLAEKGATTTYRLFKSPPNGCPGGAALDPSQRPFVMGN